MVLRKIFLSFQNIIAVVLFVQMILNILGNYIHTIVPIRFLPSFPATGRKIPMASICWWAWKTQTVGCVTVALNAKLAVRARDTNVFIRIFNKNGIKSLNPSQKISSYKKFPNLSFSKMFSAFCSHPAGPPNISMLTVFPGLLVAYIWKVKDRLYIPDESFHVEA